ncbi:phage tail tape measure protein [Limosilactobacillus reuteri]|uniref:Phage tail tape measure protein n=1 Tax=Limosilactobacillus reuteri TaxID=1598 RepID=A0A1Y2URX9_LIMRT|nr:phage tail tape measure protein [Limosilactobacillus reuteri]OTA51505.1 phage tail tape measure protein [Limosilactobacillus reuteri]OTA83166.1 phage tail tape measure protein [Limosilactobacillus reuteri]OTA86929.1 phage tail tape measure protein [Limosilactobacillus reuteri]
MADSYSVRAILSAVDQSFSSTLARAGQATQNFGSSVNQKMQGVGKAMTVAGAATTAMGVKAVSGFGKFQTSLNQAAVIAGGTSKNIGELADVANHMGAVLPISAQDAADAMVEMARNGASLDDIKKQFPAIAEASTAAGSNLQATAGVVQQAMNIWSDSLKSPQQAAAILVQTANASNASIEDMQQALATIGSTAKMAGMDMGTTSEAIGLLTNRGFSAAQASDDLNHAITQMLAPSSIAKKQMDALGLSFVDSAGKMKPFPTILQEIADKTNGMGEAQKTAALKAMFGASGMKAIAPLLDAINDKTGDAKTSWSAYAAEQDKAAHSTAAATKFLEQQANDMQQNIGSKIEQVGGNWEALRNKALQAKGGVNGAMLDMINQTLEWSTTSNNGIAQVIRSFIGLSPVIGPAITAIGAFTTNMGKVIGLAGGVIGAVGNMGRVFIVLKQASDVTTAVSGLKKLAESSKIAKAAMYGLRGGAAILSGLKAAASVAATGFRLLQVSIMAFPGAWIVAAIAAVVTALVLFFTKTKTGQKLWAGFVDFLKGAWQGLVAVAQFVWNGITKQFTAPIQVIKSLWSGIKDFFSQLWQGIVSTAQGVWSSFTTGMAPIIESIKTLWSALTGFFSTLWQSIVTGAQAIWNTLVTIFTPIVEAIKAVWQPLSEFFSTLWQGIVTVAQTVWQGLVTVIQGVWTQIQTVVQTAIQVLSTVIQTGMQVIQTVWSTVWNVIKTVVQTVWTVISTIVSTTINAIAGIIKAVTAAIQGDWSGAWNAIKSVASTVWNGIKSVVTTAINGVKSVISSVMNGIRSVMSSIWNAIKNIISSVMNGIRSVVSSGMSGVRSVVSSMMSSVRSAFSAGWNAAKSVTSSGIRGAVNIVRSMASGMVSAGRNFVMGFVNGIRGAIGAAASAAANMARSAMNAAKSALGIHSPSRVMRDQVGYYVVAGFAKGMNDNTNLIDKAANNLAAHAMPSVDIGNSINGVLSHGNLTNNIGGKIDHQLNINQQPAYINLSLGGTEYRAFVEDISREQGAQTSLRQFRF